MTSVVMQSASHRERKVDGILTVPTEIRHHIYGHLVPRRIHVSCRQGKLQLSKCLCDKPNDEPPGRDAATTGDTDCDRVWYRRLQSTWGPHWTCEEMASREVGDDSRHGPTNTSGELSITSDSRTPSILLLCKWLYADVIEYTTAATEFNFTDVRAITPILGRDDVHPLGAHRTLDFQPTWLRSIKRLSVNNRLPLSSCPLSKHPRSQPGIGWCVDFEEPPSRPAPSELWADILSLVALLRNLRRLEIWLDHDGVHSWTFVNERLLLAPLENLALRSGLSITLHIPKLHPALENPANHYIEIDRTPLIIQRRLRQRYHAVDNPRERSQWRDGLSVWHAPDFPFLLDHPELSGNKQGEELEDYERSLWKEGVNVENMSAKARTQTHIRHVYHNRAPLYLGPS